MSWEGSVFTLPLCGIVFRATMGIWKHKYAQEKLGPQDRIPVFCLFLASGTFFRRKSL